MTITEAINIVDPAIYEQGIPHETFRWMRNNAPVYRHEYSDGDFWAVTRYNDIIQVTRDWETFSSAKKMVNLWDLPDEAMKARRSIIESDPPIHARLRKLAMPPFTLRKVADYEAATRKIAATLLDSALQNSNVDLVTAISSPLPIQVIVNILGVPNEDAEYMVELSDHLVEGTTGEPLEPDAYGNKTPLELLPFNSPAAFALFEYGRKLGDERRANPHDDVVSTLVHSQVDGEHLTETEFANFFQVLVFAGNETTRTAISNGLHAFMDNPDQLQKFYDNPDLIENAVEEIIRYATPVLHFRRTATKDTEIDGHPIAAGDKVVMWYASSNFDEEFFENPLKFDVSRPTRPKHLAFGAQGPHHCIGASLARLEIKILLEEMQKRRILVERTGKIVRTRSNFVNGVLSLPARVTQAG
jgi:cytochrome P450